MGLRFCWPYQPSFQGKSYILVCTEYMMKWVEAMDLVKSNYQDVIDLLYVEIFTRFGVPKEVVTDGGPQFVSHQFEALLQKYHIQHWIASPYHPQANG